jgi:predicted phosphodiesterase
LTIAVLGDVHANLPALQSVLSAIETYEVDQLVVLGDLVGYGARPNECVELLARRGMRGVIGNHDLGALGDKDPHASRVALEVQRWTAERLTPQATAALMALPRRTSHTWWSAVHGCLIHPSHATGYITPTTAELNLDWLAEREQPPHVALFGHTHMPAAYSHAWPGSTTPAKGTIALPRGDVALINPGSVGQPRDRDPRAAFALLDLEAWTIEFVRVEYDVDAAARAIRDEGLDGSLASRLYEGC